MNIIDRRSPPTEAKHDGKASTDCETVWDQKNKQSKIVVTAVYIGEVENPWNPSPHSALSTSHS